MSDSDSFRKDTFPNIGFTNILLFPNIIYLLSIIIPFSDDVFNILRIFSTLSNFSIFFYSFDLSFWIFIGKTYITC